MNFDMSLSINICARRRIRHPDPPFPRTPVVMSQIECSHQRPAHPTLAFNLQSWDNYIFPLIRENLVLIALPFTLYGMRFLRYLNVCLIGITQEYSYCYVVPPYIPSYSEQFMFFMHSQATWS